jgi:hypothetical protein
MPANEEPERFDQKGESHHYGRVPECQNKALDGLQNKSGLEGQQQKGIVPNSSTTSGQNLPKGGSSTGRPPDQRK